MKLAGRLILLLLVTLLLLFVAMFAMKMLQNHGDTGNALRSMLDPIRKPLIRLLRGMLSFLEG